MRAVRPLLLLFVMCLLLVACQTSNPLALPTDTPAPPTATPPPTASPTPMPNTIAGFDVFLNEAEANRPDQRQELVNRFAGGLARAPIAGDEEAIFLYRGAAQSVQVLGDMNNWERESAPFMTRLEGSDLWFWRNAFEPAARLDYRIVVDNGQAILDPLNPETVPGPTGPNSEFRMPGYEAPPEFDVVGEPVPAGMITSHTLDSTLLGQTRTFQVYEPAGQIVGQRLPVIYFNNGSDYLNLINTPAILDSLIAQRQIPPIVAVFVPPINSVQDYSLNDAYAAFLAEELAPYIQETFSTSEDPAATGIVGNSLGGLAAVHAALAHPEVFGLAAAQSAPFGLDDGAFIRRAGRATSVEPRIYLVAGSYETAVAGENILESNREMARALEQRGLDIILDERPEGHSWGLWRGSLGHALGSLLSQEP